MPIDGPEWADVEPGLYGVEVWKHSDQTADVLVTGKGLALAPSRHEMECWWQDGLGICKGGFEGGFAPFNTCHVQWTYGEGEMKGMKYRSDNSRTFNYKAAPGEYDLKVNMHKISKDDWDDSELKYNQITSMFFSMQEDQINEAVRNVKGFLTPPEVLALQAMIHMRVTRWLNDAKTKCDTRREAFKAKLDEVWAMSSRETDQEPPAKTEEPSAKKAKTEKTEDQET